MNFELKNKQLISLLLAVSLLVSVFVGCSDNATVENSNSATVSESTASQSVDKEALAKQYLPEGITPITSEPSEDNLIIQTDEAKKLYKRIMEEDYPTVKELKNTKVISQIDALSEYYKALYGITADIDTDERKQLRESIKKEFLGSGSARSVTDKKTKETYYEYDGLIAREYKAEIVTGLPASGKSTRVVDPDSEKTKSFIFDCDVIKTLIPEYKESFGGAADAVHKESKMIQKEALDAFTNGDYRGDNIIIPIIGDDYDSIFDNYITPLEKAGYTITVKFVDCKSNESVARNIARELRTGRIINSEVVFSYGNKPRKVFERIKKQAKSDKKLSVG